MVRTYLVQVYGIVTGVGFRYSAINEARKYSSLKGYIRNVKEGQVEALVQGEESETKDFISWLKSGPPAARVRDFSIAEQPVNSNLKDFTLRH